MSNVRYEHLVYYEKVVSSVFWTNYAKHWKNNRDAFKMTYSKAGKEIYYIQEQEYKSLIERDK